jgi:hypothetical protein
MHLRIKNLNVLNLLHFQKPNITFLNYMFSQNLWYTFEASILFFEIWIFLKSISTYFYERGHFLTPTFIHNN